jgi:alkylhydroperoxidase/carboxymuconolactone decarboxylase family protein YurZ
LYALWKSSIVGNREASKQKSNHSPEGKETLENASEIPDKDKQKAEEIYSEIRELQEGAKSPDAFAKESTLSSRLKKLVALGSAIASQSERDVVASCVTDCLKAGAMREEVTEVLRQAILMAEIPAEIYTRIVCDAIDAFESQH